MDAHHDVFAVLQQEVRLAGVDDDDAAHQDALQPQRLRHLRVQDLLAAAHTIGPGRVRFVFVLAH